MALRDIAKSLIPPFFLMLYRKARYGNHEAKRYIWEGSYKNFKEVPLKNYDSETKGFNDFNKDAYIDTLIEEAKRSIYNTEKNNIVPHHVVDADVLLPLLTALIKNKNGKIKILDLGGGLGSSYLMLKPCFVENDQIEYTVFEVENVCKAGSAFFKDDRSIRFISELPDNSPETDIIFLKSMLQYVEDYSSFLKKISAYDSRFIFFVNLSATESPTYATLQKGEELQMAYWFININEIVDLMRTQSYSLIYKSALSRVYDQSNFPVDQRMGRACNLLFERK